MGIYEFFKELTDPQSIINYGGLALLLFVVFAETGLLVGFFLPGDSLIFVAGMICVSKPEVFNIHIIPLLALLSVAAILGNIVGYAFGYKVGPPLYNRPDSFFFKKKHLEATQKFYDKHGGKTLILGRFLPFIRTFAPILAGVIKVDFKMFMLYNIIGAIAWISTIGSCGYFLGNIPWVQANIGYIILAVSIITLIPIFAMSRKKKEPVL